MSNLPQLDPSKILERENLKLEAENKELKKRETHIELLAEALRDQRDEALEEVTRLQTLLNEADGEPVQDITSLGK